MDCEKVFKYHFLYNYTYFVTISTNYRYNDTTKIYRKFRQYVYNHDLNSHVFSVKEYTTRFHGLHYHVLVFTNKRLDYSRIHQTYASSFWHKYSISSKNKKRYKKSFDLYVKKSSRLDYLDVWVWEFWFCSAFFCANDYLHL